jgi:uncharacterized protein
MFDFLFDPVYGVRRNVYGKVVSTGVSYDNRLISVVTIENRKIVHWIDYMDSLAVTTALNSSS